MQPIIFYQLRNKTALQSVIEKLVENEVEMDVDKTTPMRIFCSHPQHRLC